MSDTKQYVGLPGLLALPLVPFTVGLIFTVWGAVLQARGDEVVTVRPRHGSSYTTTAREEGSFKLGVGGVFLVAGVLLAGWCYCKRRWLQIGPDGFTITDYRGARTYLDTDVIEYERRPTRHPGCVVRLRVVAGERSERLTLRFDSPACDSGPVGGFLERLALWTKRSGTRRARRGGPPQVG
jgi:hypothetical protein